MCSRMWKPTPNKRPHCRQARLLCLNYDFQLQVWCAQMCFSFLQGGFMQSFYAGGNAATLQVASPAPYLHSIYSEHSVTPIDTNTPLLKFAAVWRSLEGSASGTSGAISLTFVQMWKERKTTLLWSLLLHFFPFDALATGSGCSCSIWALWLLYLYSVLTKIRLQRKEKYLNAA